MTFRSKFAYVSGWVWLAFAAFNVFDLVRRGSFPSAVIASAVISVITAVVYVTSLRPATIVEENGLRVRNPFRTAFVPWNRLDDVRVSNAIIVESGDLEIRCWTPQPSAKERAKSIQGAKNSQNRSKGATAAMQAMAGRTHSDFVADQVRAAAERRARGSEGETTVRWAIAPIAACVAAVVFFVVSLTLP